MLWSKQRLTTDRDVWARKPKDWRGSLCCAGVGMTAGSCKECQCGFTGVATGAHGIAPCMVGPSQAGGAGGRCVSPLRRVVSMVLCGSARLLSQPACSISQPVLLLGFAAGCVG